MPPPASTAAYSLSATPTVYTAQVCNDVNRTGGPALWTTGFDNGQAQKCLVDWNGAPTGGEIYDLSGNLLEWTSDSQVIGGKTSAMIYTVPNTTNPTTVAPHAILLRRLACPYLAPQPSPTAANKNHQNAGISSQEHPANSAIPTMLPTMFKV